MRVDLARAKRFCEQLGDQDSAKVEGAVAEALVWNFLDDRELAIESGETSRGGPDFRCSVSGATFFVEVTNVSRDAATSVTSLVEHSLEPCYYSTLSRRVKSEVQTKAKQLADIEQAIPILIFVTTLHTDAARHGIQETYIEELLTAEQYITGNFDPPLGEVTGSLFLSTNMEHALFTRSRSIEVTRRHISAVVVAGFSVDPPKHHPQVTALGVLSPKPNVPFDPSLLMDIDFCRYRNWPPDREIEIEWLRFARKQRRAPLPPHLQEAIDKFNSEGFDQRRFEERLRFWNSDHRTTLE